MLLPGLLCTRALSPGGDPLAPAVASALSSPTRMMTAGPRRSAGGEDACPQLSVFLRSLLCADALNVLLPFWLASAHARRSNILFGLLSAMFSVPLFSIPLFSVRSSHSVLFCSPRLAWTINFNNRTELQDYSSLGFEPRFEHKRFSRDSNWRPSKKGGELA